jgi:segregation and condensation protein B
MSGEEMNAPPPEAPAPEAAPAADAGASSTSTSPGASAELNRLSEMLEQRLDAPVEVAQPIRLPAGGTLAAAVEAVLLVANEPMSGTDLMRVLEGATRAEVNAAVRELKARYAERPSGFDLVEVAGGVRLMTRPDYAPWVERIEKIRREERLSKAQLEVLAAVAYRQPLLRSDIDSVRGADSGGAIRALIEKGLIKVAGRADTLGRPLLYGTTDRFLERFALKNLKDLPKPRTEA